MRKVEFFFNGGYRSVLQEIANTHTAQPEQILFLQPFKKRLISYLHGDTIEYLLRDGSKMNLREDPATVDAPMQFYASTLDDLFTVSYTAEIVGYDFKQHIGEAERQRVQGILRKFQPREYKEDFNLYSGANLIHIRRMKKLEEPFNVTRLIQCSDGKPVRSKKVPGGWSYVRPVRK